MSKKNEFGLKLPDFSALGDMAGAGLEATRLALSQAKSSAEGGRIPIAGAAVEVVGRSSYRPLTVGCNGRIPDRSGGKGYPSDHGETAAIRNLRDFAKIDWSRVVFATTLSPCIMCGRTIEFLHSLGLRHLTVAESESFPGTLPRLRKLRGMKIAALTNKFAIEMMCDFSSKYPWDWAADIGAIPPGRLPELLPAEPRAALISRALKFARREESRAAALVTSASGEVLAEAADGRSSERDNPCISAPMLAMGLAGSAVNLRECGLIFAVPGLRTVSLECFGHSSIGACELFLPAWIQFSAPPDPLLRSALTAAGIKILSAGK